MGQHQAKVDNSGPSPPPIFGYEPGFGAYPLGNPPKEVVAIQKARTNGETLPTFDTNRTKTPLPGALPFRPMPGRTVVNVDVNQILANAPPFPRSNNEKNAGTQLPKKGEICTAKDIDFDIADIITEIPCDPVRKSFDRVSDIEKSKFSMNSLLDIPKDSVGPKENIPSDPVLNNSPENIDGTYYDEPAKDSQSTVVQPIVPPPVPKRNTSLTNIPFFNPFGMLPNPFVKRNEVRNTFIPSIDTSNRNSPNTTCAVDKRTELDIIVMLSAIIRLMPVLWAPKFSSEEETRQVELAWEDVGKKMFCSSVWPLQRLKIVWLTNAAKFKNNLDSKDWIYYKYFEFLDPVFKGKTEKGPVRVPGRKSSLQSSYISEYESDYIPPQKIRNTAKTEY